MKVFSKLEEISERFIEGLFKGKGSAVEPVEIAKKLVRDMETQQRISVSKVYVPNEFIVYLNPDNKQKLASLELSLTTDLARYLQEKATEKGYSFTGLVKVTLAEEEDIKPGQVRIESNFSHDREEAPVDEQVAKLENTQVFSGTLPISTIDISRADLVIVNGQDEGMTFRLSNFPIYLGRQRANEVFIDDVNVSRKHALLDLIKGGYFLSDLDSLNGTYVNGQEISRTKIEDGDLIKIGVTTLKFRMVTE